MSVQFGRWNFDGKPADSDYLNKVKSVVAPYGPDEAGFYTKSGFSTLYCAFHTSKESRHKMQPRLSTSGTVITWDGRLDNRSDLIHELRDVVSNAAADVEIVVAAYERWGTDCLARLIGDWALVIWNPSTRSLLLAKDSVGIRPLFYAVDNQGVAWSTILDPLVLFAGKTFALCEEYIAGWFSFFPAAHLTPYIGIHSVPPSSFVLVCPDKQTIRKYWDFDPSRKVSYRTDPEYEERFRTVFADAVRRRLRSDTPVLAELSGGMDSSSIVCMADAIIAQRNAECPRLDTVSYYNDSEPNWNERPYFTKVEETRGRPGCHIDVSSSNSSIPCLCDTSPALTPGEYTAESQQNALLTACMHSNGNRVVLSGIGGDEMTGGVPAPTPELADLLARGRFHVLARQLTKWAMVTRQPWFHLLFATCRRFLSPNAGVGSGDIHPAGWLYPDFVRRHQAALAGYDERLHIIGSLPSFQENLSALRALQRQLECSGRGAKPLCEVRYPYLDRDLLEFLFAIPREQVVQPGQRRSLMRRALARIVPREILERKRKAFIMRAPMVAISQNWARLEVLTEHMVSDAMGIVNARKYHEVLLRIRHGHVVPMVPVMRTLLVEQWLRGITQSTAPDRLRLRGQCPASRLRADLPREQPREVRSAS